MSLKELMLRLRVIEKPLHLHKLTPLRVTLHKEPTFAAMQQTQQQIL